MASGWDFLAGFAGSLGGSLQEREQRKQQERLKKMEEEALLKRQMFLEDYRATVDQAGKEADYERTKNDVTAQFTNPETGEVMGRTKSGKTIPLLETSEEYKSATRSEKLLEAQKKQLDIEAAGMRPDLIRAQTDSARASADRARRPAVERDKPDPLPAEIRKAYAEEVTRLRGLNTDEAELFTAAQVNLYPMYGKENIQRSLGGRDSAPRSDNPASAPLAQASQSVTQPNAPTVEEILARANAAIKAGKDPASVEATIARLMNQYGYTQ